DLQVGFGIDDLCDSSAHHLVIIDEKHTSHHSAPATASRGTCQRTRVPPSTRGSILHVPPCPWARATRFVVPLPRESSAGIPIPSSSTITVKCEVVTETLISVIFARAWRATLLSDS